MRLVACLVVVALARPASAVWRSRPLPPNHVGDLLAALHAEPFDTGRRDLLERAAAARWFSLVDVYLLASDFAFTDERLRVIGIVGPRVIDHAYLELIDSLFPMAEDRARARALIR